MIKEFSAGGVIVKKKDKSILFLLLLQRLKDGQLQWVWPKGHINRGETTEEAARREIAEEAGLRQLKKITFLGNLTYTFVEDDITHQKSVAWYLFSTITQKTHLLAKEGFIQSQWLTYEETLNTLTHQNCIPFLMQAYQLLR